EVDPAPAPAANPAVLGLDQGTRPDKAHLALEHVPCLRQLVEAGAPQHTPDASDAGVTLHQEPVRIATVRQERLDLLFGSVDHRAELHDEDAPFPTADAPLAEEHRTGGVELDRRGDD